MEGETPNEKEILLDNERNYSMREIGALIFLASSGWVGEKRLVRAFGKESLERLLKKGAIRRRWKDDPMFSEYEYSITDYGRNQLEYHNR